jgi:hypothetical protein
LRDLRIDRSTTAASVGLVLVGAYMALLAYAMRSWPYDRWMLLILAPLLLAIGALIIWRVTRHDEVPLTRLIIAALAAKMVASFVRYVVVFDVYSSGDAYRYDNAGLEIADAFHRGEMPLSGLIPSETSTRFVEQFTGLAYSLMGPTRLGGFLLFSWIAFWGLFLFHRAALIGLPEGNQRRYALLLLFLPSLLFWPSSLGKESLIMFALGLSAYGAARILERRPRGWVPAAMGVGLTYMVRPHVAAVVLASFALAFLLRRRGKRRPLFGPVARLAMVGLLVLATSVVLGQAVDRFLPEAQVESSTTVPELGESTIGAADVSDLFERAAEGTDEGGSAIDTVLPTNPLDYPYAAFTVLFRPTLVDVTSVTTLFAALETTGLAALFIVSWRRLRNLPHVMIRRPYVLMSVAYVGIFAFAWSSFANLGALARQRVQMLPFLLLLLAVPLVLDHRETRRGTGQASSSDAVDSRGVLSRSTSSRRP